MDKIENQKLSTLEKSNIIRFEYYEILIYLWISFLSTETYLWGGLLRTRLESPPRDVVHGSSVTGLGHIIGPPRGSQNGLGGDSSRLDLSTDRSGGPKKKPRGCGANQRNSPGTSAPGVALSFIE